MIDATVIETGESGLLQLQGGARCRTPLREGVPIGATGKLLLRPEALRLFDGDTSPAHHNVLKGRVDSTLVTGGTSKHFIALESGGTVAVQELTNQDTLGLQPGHKVSVGRPENAARFLRK